MIKIPGDLKAIDIMYYVATREFMGQWDRAKEEWEHVWFGVDAWMPKYLSPPIIQFINSRWGRDRCLWGTNGLPWKESLRQLEELGLKEEVKRKLLRDNAVQLFKLDG
jgi:predicted TIM-barrel fold metal-dependent hydrolase